MNNYQQPGFTLSAPAPYDRTSGQAALIGSLVGVAAQDVLSGVTGDFQFSGVFRSLPKVAGTAWTVGQKLYWDNAAKTFSHDSTVGQLAGVAAEAALAAATTGVVRLNGVAPATAEGAQAAIADLVDNSGGAVADGTIGVVTPPAAITDNSGGVDPGDNIIAAITNANNAGSADVLPTAAAIAQLAAKQNVDRTAIIALTDAVTELSTKLNATLAALRAAGTISP